MDLGTIRPNPVVLWTHFAREVDRLELVLKKYGYKLTASKDDRAHRKFNSFSLEAQRSVLDSLISYNGLLFNAERRGIDLTDNRKLLWSVLKDLKKTPCGDIMDKIDDGDLVEIYDSSFVQRFRNLLFFDLCSYTVAEVLIFDWPSLYQRPPEVTEKLIKKFSQSFLPGAKTEAFGSPVHSMWEVFSTERRKFEIADKFHSPVWEKNQSSPWGAIATKKATRIEAKNEAS